MKFKTLQQFKTDIGSKTYPRLKKCSDPSLLFAARSPINIISLPRRIFYIDAETLAGSPYLVLRRHDVDAAVLLQDIVHV